MIRGYQGRRLYAGRECPAGLMGQRSFHVVEEVTAQVCVSFGGRYDDASCLVGTVSTYYVRRTSNMVKG